MAQRIARDSLHSLITGPWNHLPMVHRRFPWCRHFSGEQGIPRCQCLASQSCLSQSTGLWFSQYPTERK